MRHQTFPSNHDPEPLESISARQSGAKCGSAAQNSFQNFLAAVKKPARRYPDPRKQIIGTRRSSASARRQLAHQPTNS